MRSILGLTLRLTRKRDLGALLIQVNGIYFSLA